jgi:hypothetical protein
MSHLHCPDCGLSIAAISAPSICPRCLVRRRGRFEMVTGPEFALPPSPAMVARARADGSGLGAGLPARSGDAGAAGL